MAPSGSVTAWLSELRTGDETALAKLHARYWPQLVALARSQLRGAPGAVADEEDVAQEAFWTFYRRLRAGQPFSLSNRQELLALLSHIIACKAVNQIQHELGVQKRGEGRIHPAVALDLLTGTGLAREAPTPLEQAILTDAYRHYLSALPDSLRPFAELYLAGYTHREIAARMGCVERTVERKTRLALEKWRQMASD